MTISLFLNTFTSPPMLIVPIKKMGYNSYMSAHTLPPYVTQYFWGDNLLELDLQKNQKYIVKTLLEQGDIPALHWLFSQVDKQTINNYLPTLRLDKKSQHFWSIYLA